MALDTHGEKSVDSKVGRNSHLGEGCAEAEGRWSQVCFCLLRGQEGGAECGRTLVGYGFDYGRLGAATH